MFEKREFYDVKIVRGVLSSCWYGCGVPGSCPFPGAKSSNSEGKSEVGPDDHSLEFVIRFVPDAEPPFQLNEAAAKQFVEEKNRRANERLDLILSQMADLVAEHPDSPAADIAKRMVEESDYYLTDYGRLYPKGAMIFGGVVLVR